MPVFIYRSRSYDSRLPVGFVPGYFIKGNLGDESTTGTLTKRKSNTVSAIGFNPLKNNTPPFNSSCLV